MERRGGTGSDRGLYALMQYELDRHPDSRGESQNE